MATRASLEEAEVKVNAAFMAMATKAVDTMWMEMNADMGVPGIVAELIKENYRLHRVGPRTTATNMFWNESPGRLVLLRYGSRPATHPVFDRIPMSNYGQSLESGLLLANRRLAVAEGIEVASSDEPIIWVPREDQRFGKVFETLRRLDDERLALSKATRKLVYTCSTWRIRNSEARPAGQAMSMACHVLPVLRHVLEMGSVPPWQGALGADEIQELVAGIDMGAIMPAMVRLEHHFHNGGVTT